MINALRSSLLRRIDHHDAVNPKRPCVVIAEYQKRFVPVPNYDEIFLVENEKTEPGPEAIGIRILIFWAADQNDSGIRKLILWNHWDAGILEQQLWTEIKADTWSVTPRGECLTRLFESMDEAERECPNAMIIAFPDGERNRWNRFMIHSPVKDSLECLRLVVRPEGLSLIRIPLDAIPFRTLHWNNRIQANLPVYILFPNLKEDWLDQWNERIRGTPTILHMVVTRTGSLIILMALWVENTNTPYVFWKEFGFDEARFITSP